MEKTVKIDKNVTMPSLGFGVYRIPAGTETKAAVLAALAAGYRHIDTATSYGNEAAVGEALKESGLARNQVFLTSKLWVADASYQGAKLAIRRSLDRLQVDYLDLFLIHQPYHDIFGAWQALAEAKAAGLIRAIGVSNFPVDTITNLAEFSGIKPAVNQIEVNPFQQNQGVVTYLQNYGVAVEAWAPFAEGRQGLFTNPVLTAIGQAHGKSVAQVVLRWLLERGIVPVAKSTKSQRMIENQDVFDFELSPAEMEAISGLDQDESQFFSHRDPKIIQWMAHRNLAEE